VVSKNFSPEFKESCVLEVVRNSRTIAEVARENGVVQQTLRNWVNKYRDEHPEPEDELSVSERARLKELEKKVRELQAENEFLGKAAAFFAKKHR
jgi:transposase